MNDPDDREVNVAHVIRNQRILATVYVEPLTNGQWLVKNVNMLQVTAPTKAAALALGEQYLEGYAHGYDEGYEAGQHDNHPRRHE